MTASKSAVALVLVLLLIAGCTGSRQYPSALLTADSLADYQPDSALELLKRIEPEMADASKPVQAYYQLLCIKAVDKTEQMAVTTDSIDAIVSYYEDEGDPSLLSMAYYYAGRVYSEENDAPTALSYFQKSLDTMDSKENLQLQSVIYSQMGYLFLYQRIFKEAENCFFKSIECGKELNDTVDVIYGLKDLADTYLWQDMFDESLKYIHEAETLATKSSNLKMKVMVSKKAASIAIDMGNYQKARNYMQLPLQHFELSDSSSIYATMQRIFYATEDIDSFFYYARGIERFGSVYAKHRLYKHLTDVYLKQGKYELADQSFQKYLDYSDSVKNITKTEELQRVYSLYNYQRKEAENEKLKYDNRIKKGLLWTLLIFVTILSFATYLIYIIRKSNNQEKVKRIKALQAERYRKSQAFIDENNRKIVQLESQITEHETQLEVYKSRLLSLNAIAIADMNEKERANNVIKNSDIRKSVIKRASENMILTDNDWIQVDIIINDNYPEFNERLFLLHNFSTQEYHVALLTKLQISPSGIATLTAHTKSSITLTKSRLYKKCFGEKGSAEQWDAFVNSL